MDQRFQYIKGIGLIQAIRSMLFRAICESLDICFVGLENFDKPDEEVGVEEESEAEAEAEAPEHPETSSMAMRKRRNRTLRKVSDSAF